MYKNLPENLYSRVKVACQARVPTLDHSVIDEVACQSKNKSPIFWEIPCINDKDALRWGCRIRVMGYQCRPSRELEASFQPFGYSQTTERLQPIN